MEDDYEYESEYDYSDEEEDWEYSASMTTTKTTTLAQDKNDKSIMASTMGSVAGIRTVPAAHLIPEMERRVKDVADLLGIPSNVATVLLRQCKWSEERLLEKFYSNDSKTQWLQHCGVYARCYPTRRLSADNTRSTASTCPICYEDMDGGNDNNVLAMPCGHEFCSDCWHKYCINAITEDGSTCVHTTCPEAGCTEVLTEREVELAAPELLSKFQTFQLLSFVESNPLTRWCPGPGCERVACASSASAMENEGNIAHCSFCGGLDGEGCGMTTSFCMICGQEPHMPCDCQQLSKWIEKCRSESESAKWILAYTKSCPKCLVRIEKNQGCNHMTCKKCKFEFCWICMGNWKEHNGGHYTCNKFDTSSNSNNGKESAAERAKRELDRYLHYYKRYQAHDVAQKFAHEQLKEKTNARMLSLQNESLKSSSPSSNDANWSNVEFLKTANQKIVKCRRVLKHTYIYGYFMNSTTTTKMQQQRFEYHQEMLERFTETLQELSEKSIKEMDRTDVVNQTRAVDIFMKNMLTYVEDGMNDGE